MILLGGFGNFGSAFGFSEARIQHLRPATGFSWALQWKLEWHVVFAATDWDLYGFSFIRFLLSQPASLTKYGNNIGLQISCIHEVLKRDTKAVQIITRKQRVHQTHMHANRLITQRSD